MTNQELIEALPRLLVMERKLAALKPRIQRLLDLEDKIGYMIGKVRAINTVIDGVAMSVDISGYSATIKALGGDIDRWAEIYENAYARGSGICGLNTYAGMVVRCSNWHGAYWSFDNAMDAGIAWVARRITPGQRREYDDMSIDERVRYEAHRSVPCKTSS